jgi:hypothetical protein
VTFECRSLDFFTAFDEDIFFSPDTGASVVSANSAMVSLIWEQDINIDFS